MLMLKLKLKLKLWCLSVNSVQNQHKGTQRHQQQEQPVRAKYLTKEKKPSTSSRNNQCGPKTLKKERKNPQPKFR